ncbi:hypothetical protein V6N11_082336 [Hibiscus sabdariffa]|uniref:Uncharacterized protein n=2 Tax=Hibiscus sabdariffa TaxID=183260 RepID=A0ABR2BH45_9ROSI
MEDGLSSFWGPVTAAEWQQQGGETPMVWEMLIYFYILYSPDWHYRSTKPIFLLDLGSSTLVACTNTTSTLSIS